MAPPLLRLYDIHVNFGGEPLLDGVEMSVAEGDRLCLVGRNGSGKSTLLKVAAGLIEADRGQRFVQPGATIRYLPQEPDLAGHETTLAYVEAGLAPGDDPHQARYLLEQLGLKGGEDPATLSGGEARRCAIARLLAPEPDILLLDEPTNHLDLTTIEWLETTLASRRSALVIISHDRRFLEHLSRATLWISRGVVRRLDRNFREFEDWRDDLLEKEEAERHKRDRKIAAETDWLHHGGVTARRKRNQGRLRALETLRQQRRVERREAGSVKMTLAQAAASGKLVAEAKGISKSFGDHQVISDLTVRILRGDRVGIVGPNGAGKTTLLNLLTDALTPDSGSIRFGANLEAVTHDQQRESLDLDVSLWDALTGGGGDTVFVAGRPRHVVGYMKDFLFAPEQAHQPIGSLSGGKRGRLMLARALARPSNLLVLDEPTNDLDLETLDLFQEILADYAGTVLVVSHDRDFLDRIVTSVIAWDGDGRWTEYAGGYTDMTRQRRPAPVAAPRTSARSSRAKTETLEPVAAPKRKLSFKEAHARKTLPVRMADLENEIARLQAVLADPELYARDRHAFAETAARLDDATTELSKTEDEWLALELLNEEHQGR